MAGVKSQIKDLSSFIGQGTPGPAFCFRFVIEVESSAALSTSESENLTLLVKGGTFPIKGMETFSQTRENSTIYFPGDTNTNQVEMVVYEMEGNPAYNFFKKWQNAMINSDGTYNLPGYYKKGFSAKRLNSAGEVDFELNYLGGFPVRISDYTPDWSNLELQIFTITISVDDVL